jgi:hypothetical protein
MPLVSQCLSISKAVKQVERALSPNHCELPAPSRNNGDVEVCVSVMLYIDLFQTSWPPHSASSTLRGPRHGGGRGEGQDFPEQSPNPLCRPRTAVAVCWHQHQANIPRPAQGVWLLFLIQRWLYIGFSRCLGEELYREVGGGDQHEYLFLRREDRGQGAVHSPVTRDPGALEEFKTRLVDL